MIINELYFFSKNKTAMKQRHWDRIEKTTGCKFDWLSENFQLRHVMEAPLLENKDDLEGKFCNF